jgi:Protein of unknown function (DUF1592)/Protein of unknown function (DUF1588)/Protein of unknown function (DUF1595)/Protein of unknown function (DUF1587)/Protein of unknown function (DUF1585)
MRMRSPSRIRATIPLAIALAAGACGGPQGGNSDPFTPPASGRNGGKTGSQGGGTGGNSGSSSGSGNTGSNDPGPPPAYQPGRVTLRRLNYVEYDNTLRDLLGIEWKADAKPSVKFQFPADEWGDGFFNDGDVLTSSPLTIEKYLGAAQYAIDQAFDGNANKAARDRIFTCNPSGSGEGDCLKKIVGEFARRAFRRPVTDEEVTPYLGLVEVAKKKGDSAEVGLKLALSAVLVSPDFLFRVELDTTPGKARILNDYEVASRLSYFIWASMPDEQLFGRAKDGALTKPEEVKTQVRRMLADPKASAFSLAMSEQWLHAMALQFAKPEKKFFPKWEEPVRDALAGEVNAFLAPILSGSTPAQEILTAKYVYANRMLGMYYGLPNAMNLPVDKFEKVMVTDNRRGGVLRQGSFLVHTSHPDTHSPTIRGKFILDKLLCSPPPPPPPTIPSFMPQAEPTGTLRQKLTKLHHAMGGACEACHAIIDPMGFALENYDGSGQWRDKDNGLDVDATGKMPGTEQAFNGAGELSEILAKDSRFASCLAKQVLTYATGRHLKDDDKPLIEELGKKFSSGGWKFPELVELVATSAPMTHRQSE